MNPISLPALNATDCTSPVPSGIDITALWDHCHAHLRPLPSHLPLPAEPTLGHCPHCGSDDAIRVLAHVRFGEQHWEERQTVAYCRACGHYWFPTIQLRHKLELLGQLPITAVNARLWCATPSFLNIEPTTHCNFNCWYCVGRHMKQEDIRVEDFARMLDNFSTVKTIALVGEGEPLLHKEFFAMVEMAHARGIRLMMISNGSTFSPSVVRKLCELEVAYIGISIDSTDPAVFARSRIDGKLDKIWQGIERLRRYRDDHGYRYPKIGLKGTLFTYSQNALPEIVAEAKKHGVEIFESFQVLNPMRTYTPIYPVAALNELSHIEEVANAISRDSAGALGQLESVLDFCRRENIEVDKNGNPNGLRNNCDEQWIYSLLSGDITPCCQIKTVMSENWNIFNHPIEHILSDHHYENTRFNLWNGLFPNYCEGCWKTR